MGKMWDGSANPDGAAYYRGSVRMVFDNQTVEFFGEASWGQKLTRGIGYGMDRSQGPMKWTRGKLETNGLKVKGFAGGVQKMREYLAAGSDDGLSYGNTPITIFFQYLDRNESPIDVCFEVCLFDEEAASIADSPDPLQEELTFWFKRKSQNGLTLEDRSEAL